MSKFIEKMYKGAIFLFSYNPLPFRNNLIEEFFKIIMEINEKSQGEKILYDPNPKAAEVSALLLTNINTVQVKKYCD